MISEAEVFISQCIDISKFFYAAAAPAVLQHSLYNITGPFAMMVNFFKILFQVLCYLFGIFQVALTYFFIHFIYQLSTYIRKIIDEV